MQENRWTDSKRKRRPNKDDDPHRLDHDLARQAHRLLPRRVLQRPCQWFSDKLECDALNPPEHAQCQRGNPKSDHYVHAARDAPERSRRKRDQRLSSQNNQFSGIGAQFILEPKAPVLSGHADGGVSISGIAGHRNVFPSDHDTRIRLPTKIGPQHRRTGGHRNCKCPAVKSGGSPKDLHCNALSRIGQQIRRNPEHLASF